MPHRRILAACLSLLALTASAVPGDAAPVPSTAETAAADGQHAFDWEIGTWRSQVRVLAEPLSASPDVWLTFDGTSVVRPLMDGRANVVEFDVRGVRGTTGRIEALNLRLYEPQADRWSLTFANLRDGLLAPAVYGGFRDGVGEFYGDDQLGGRPIKVRFLIERRGPDKARFEQAFSDDGGLTWETNWIVVDRRI
ncbi:hypothetical protein E1212_25300 [Jiangella ureilytica]|uniref:DUF1579 domain-containing protein n=1 Tax=Jiangella ureilytica TaxID=2530374 RepID=A0A4R4RCU6_9ACTN|nr:hypothetical protein [Jiangella ureilytica]TDC47098.1 hypothetical protein E1212_25300 [Jiangella ureilytica]